MKISIITINLNNCEGLLRTMKSVLSQTYQDFEYIVIDGGSTDGSCAVIETYRKQLAHCTSEPDKGIYNAMNKGIAAAHGVYCLFMNSGDMLHDAHVLERVAPLLQGKDFYVGDMQQYGHKRHLIKAPQTLTAGYLVNKYLPHQSAFIRTALLKVRPYREDYLINSDWEQMLFELIVHNASYEALGFIISDFDTTGISSTSNNQETLCRERRKILYELFPPRVADSLVGETKLAHKLRFALGLSSPLSRDLKILRNVLKVLPRDLWHTCFRKRGKDI